MKWEVGKTYKTRGGWEARVLCTDGEPSEPLGALHIKADGVRCLKEHGVDGSYYSDMESEYDLMRPKPELRGLLYGTYSSNGHFVTVCFTKEAALRWAKNNGGTVRRFIEDGEVTE